MRRATPFDINPQEDIKAFKSRSVSIISQVMPFLAHIIPAKNSRGLYSASSVFELLAKNEEYCLNNVYFSGEQILQYMRVFNHKNTSEYLDAQAKSPQFSAATPIVLAAYRQQLGIKYEQWDKADPLLKRFFGPQMQWLFDPALSVPDLNDDEFREFRENVLLERKTGLLKPATSYKFESSGEPNFDKLPKMLRMMLLQTWIFHPSIRHPNMITDPLNWDNLADARETQQISAGIIAKPREEVKVKVFDDLGW